MATLTDRIAARKDRGAQLTLAELTRRIPSCLTVERALYGDDPCRPAPRQSPYVRRAHAGTLPTKEYR